MGGSPVIGWYKEIELIIELSGCSVLPSKPLIHKALYGAKVGSSKRVLVEVCFDTNHQDPWSSQVEDALNLLLVSGFLTSRPIRPGYLVRSIDDKPARCLECNPEKLEAIREAAGVFALNVNESLPP